jgi:hypothetical protein
VRPRLPRPAPVRTEPRLAAAPNPVPGGLGAGTTAISWTTGDGSPGQVYVSDGAGEALFAEAPAGFAPAPWIENGRTYRFTLVAAAGASPLATVDVVRDDVPWAAIGAEISQYAVRDEYAENVVGALVSSLEAQINSERRAHYFRLWEKRGMHVTPVHFYSPIPDTRTLPEELWEHRSQVVGIELNVKSQLALLRDAFPVFRDEYDRFPFDPTDKEYEYYFNNPQFGGTDGLVLYCAVRHFKPSLIIEVGSGFSSRVSAQAALANGDTRLICVEPYFDGTERHEVLRRGFPGLTSLVSEKVEDLDYAFFDQLESGDILFIDTSHVVRIGGDVTFLILEVLPRLKPGVLVHVHDIFLPFEYPRDWVHDMARFYNEQYLLQAFLAFNSEFEVVFTNHYLGRVHLDAFRATFPRSPWWGGASFWIRRKRADVARPE